MRGGALPQLAAHISKNTTSACTTGLLKISFQRPSDGRWIQKDVNVLSFCKDKIVYRDPNDGSVLMFSVLKPQFDRAKKCAQVVHETWEKEKKQAWRKTDGLSGSGGSSSGGSGGGGSSAGSAGGSSGRDGGSGPVGRDGGGSGSEPRSAEEDRTQRVSV